MPRIYLTVMIKLFEGVKVLKEIVYYDEETVNSVLSQFGEGIIQKLQLEESELEADTETAIDDGKIDSGLTMNLKLSSGSLPGGEVNLGGKFGGIKGSSYGTSRTLSEGQKDIIEKIFHDHALDILLNNLNEKYNLNVNSTELTEGDFTIFNGGYSFYDFELYKRTLNSELLLEFIKMSSDAVPEQEKNTIKKFMESVKNKQQLSVKDKEKFDEYLPKYQSILAEEEASKTFKMLSVMSTYSNDILNGLVIFKIGKNLVIGKKDNMRVASEALSFRTDSSIREIKVLGKVIGKKGAKIEMGNILNNFMTQDFDKIPAMILDVVLGALQISGIDDVIINPIAIYYEEN